MDEGVKLCKPRLALILLCGFGAAYSDVSLAVEWQIKPRIDVVETYSDNIALASDADVADNDYITQIVPAITLNGNGNRLKLDSSYSLQNISYADNSSSNQTHNQFQLGADAELVDELFYLSVDGELSQQLLSPGNGVSADNLNIGSGRSDVVTSRVQPSLKRRLGKYVEFDLSYSEGRVNYDNNATVADGRLQGRKFSMGRSRESAKLDWQLDYSQSRQWAAETLTSESEQSAATLRYDLFDRVSLIANGGNEDGQISNSTKSYASGAYWSAGLMWRPSPHLSLEAASGDKDRQASLMWAPSARTSLNASYLDREVGVRASNTWTGAFKHSTRRTLWTLSYVEEITSDAVQAVIGFGEPEVMLDKNGEPIFNEFGKVQITQQALLGVVDEHYRRESSQAGFTYTARKNDLSLGVSSEQRHYELTDRQSQLHGGFLGWRLRLSGRTSSNVRYMLNKTIEDSVASELETRSLTWSLSSTLGKHVTTGIELRTTEVDGGTATLSHGENRLSANARVAF